MTSITYHDEHAEKALATALDMLSSDASEIFSDVTNERVAHCITKAREAIDKDLQSKLSESLSQIIAILGGIEGKIESHHQRNIDVVKFVISGVLTHFGVKA